MLVRVAILLTVLATFPSVLCSRIGSISNQDELPRNTDLPNARSGVSKRQFPNTSLQLRDKPPKTLHAQEGDGKILQCRAGGMPPPAIHWLKDGIIISEIVASQELPHESSPSEGDGGKLKANGSLISSRLYLDCLSVEDEGEYTCVAENPYHKSNASTQLTVSSSDEEVECEEKAHGQSPRITQWTMTMLGTQGETGRLTCRADGYPRPTLRWLGPNNEELTKADFNKYEILQEGDLIIRSMEWTDMGTFQCLAENIHGEAKVESFVYPALKDK